MSDPENIDLWEKATAGPIHPDDTSSLDALSGAIAELELVRRDVVVIQLKMRATARRETARRVLELIDKRLRVLRTAIESGLPDSIAEGDER